MKITVIGAGIAGLGAGYKLRRNKREYLVLERNRRSRILESSLDNVK